MARKQALEQASKDFANKLKVLDSADDYHTQQYQKRNGFNLTDNGHLALEAYQFAKSQALPNYQVMFLKKLKELYEKSVLGYRDVRRITAEILGEPMSAPARKILSSQADKLAPWHAIFFDQEFIAKYQKDALSSPIFEENYRAIMEGLKGKAFQCRFAYF